MANQIRDILQCKVCYGKMRNILLNLVNNPHLDLSKYIPSNSLMPTNKQDLLNLFLIKGAYDDDIHLFNIALNLGANVNASNYYGGPALSRLSSKWK